MESLPARQVEQLLLTLRAHNSMLDSAYHDSRRLAVFGRRPAYLVDFELLFRYMLRADEHPEWEQELRYLVSHRETLFLIGPGTAPEIERFLTRRGLHLGIDTGGIETGNGAPAHDVDATSLAVSRLAGLLKQPNVRAYANVVDPAEVDTIAYAIARAALDKRRSRASRAAIQADALNWAAVVYMRRELESLELEFYPYLLTATRPLLDERSWSDEIGTPISRSPAEAIYTEVLFETFGDSPERAMNHTVMMSFQASALERELKVSPAQLNPVAFTEQPEWERVVTEGRVGEGLRAQLIHLAEFVRDPVIRETQRIYDNAQRVAVSQVQQRGTIMETGDQSASQLFDLISGITAALQATPPGASGLANLWDTVLEVRASGDDELMTYELCERGGDYLYLAAESHLADDPDSDSLLIFRWPSSLDVAGVLGSFSWAFQRHGIGTIDMYVGVPGRVLEFEADIPVTLPDLLEALATASPPLDDLDADDSPVPLPDEAATLLGDADPASANVAWVRMDSGAFDLYADVVNATPRDPLIGLFVEQPDVGAIADLYGRTCARYLFRTWLVQALEAIIGDAQGTGPRIERSQPRGDQP